MFEAGSNNDSVVRDQLLRRWCYEENGRRALIPVDRRPVGVIPSTGFDPSIRYPDVCRDLREISRDYRLIYDPYTKNENDPEYCGLHVYTIHEGCLVLEKSCQVNIGCNDPDCQVCFKEDERWPNGKPCAPRNAWHGRGIVAWLKAHDKARMGYTRDAGAKWIRQTTVEANTQRQETIEKDSRQLARDWWDEATTMLSRHGHKLRYRGCKAHLNRKPSSISNPAA